MVAIRAGAREVPVLKSADVRFGSKADICSASTHVHFIPESGHGSVKLGEKGMGRTGRRPPLHASQGSLQIGV
jgi:hypothetical protein